MRVCPKCKLVYGTRSAVCSQDQTALIDTDTDPFLGKQLERYRLIAILGAGGIGRVYRAVHSVLGAEFAVKVLNGEMAANPAILKRLQREAQAMSRIKHPNVAVATDAGTSPDGISFLVMELLIGTPLDRLIAEQGRLPPVRAAAIARQIALGLEAAHELGFVHRDLKPANVMLTMEQGVERVKLLDFGLVGIVDDHGGEKLTLAGCTVGTPAYMAPEQLASSRVDHRADLYSLGVILHEMLTGRLPKKRPSTAATERDPSFLTIPGLTELGNWLLDKVPEQRPASARAVAQSLAEILGVVETASKPTTQPVAVAPTAWGGDGFDEVILASSDVVQLPPSLEDRGIERESGPISFEDVTVRTSEPPARKAPDPETITLPPVGRPPGDRGPG